MLHAGAIEPDNWVPNEKLSNPEVRQAIAWAIDRRVLLVKGMVKDYFMAMANQSTRQLQFNSGHTMKKQVFHYTYDPDKSKEMLDGLGYVDKDGDGYREDPDGKEWVLNMEYPTGNQIT